MSSKNEFVFRSDLKIINFEMSFNELHPQLFYIIFDYLNANDIINMALLSKILYCKTSEYLKRHKFVRIRSWTDFQCAKINNLPIIIFNETLQKSFFRKLYNYLYPSDINWQSIMEYSCLKGNINNVKIAIQNGAKNWNDGLVNACQGGNLDIVELMIENGADCWGALEEACEWGHKNIAELMIKKGATDFNEGLVSACIGGHIELVKLMIEKGANNFNWGLAAACIERNKVLIKFMIELGATVCFYCRKSIHEH